MRSIGTVKTRLDALRFSAYLERLGIAHTSEPDLEPEGQFISYQFWVHDEDRLEEAKSALDQFLENPTDSLFDIPLSQISEEEEEKQPLNVDKEKRDEPGALQKARGYLAHLVIALCAFIFSLNTYQEIPLLEEGAPQAIFSFTPVQTLFLYDLPPFFEKLTELMQKHKIPLEGKVEKTLSPEIQSELNELPQVVYWRGFYDWLVLRLKTQNPSEAEGPLWIKIRQGELWRLFSPCVLHAGLLHILFNMLWVWLLLRPVEQRLGAMRAVFLMILVGVGSNTAQYLMGGPFFLGYSGIVMGLAGFIWSRQKIAPWEGYPIQKPTLLFLLFFVLAMSGLQSVSFVLQIFSDIQFSPNIANTAHLMGGFLGALLGRLRLFSWRIA